MIAIISIGLLNMLACTYGTYCTFKRRSLLLFCWMIFLYFGIVSLLVCLDIGEYNLIFRLYSKESFRQDTKIILLSNMLFCNLSFLLVEYFQRKKSFAKVDFSFLKGVWVKILVAVMCVSLVLVFLQFYGQDYDYFVTSDDGGGWGLIFFQVSVCSVIYLFQRRNWKMLGLILFFVLLIITTTHVRSLLFYPIFPITIYILNNWLHTVKNFRRFIVKVFRIAVIMMCIGFVLSIIRYGVLRIPETELPSISMHVIEYAGNRKVEDNTSLQNFLYGFVAPYITEFGIRYTPPQSVPYFNAEICYGYSDFNNEAHFPAMIYHDFYMNYGYFSFIAALFFYLYLSLICSYMQTHRVSFYVLSAIVPWHIYMLIRGSTDYASMGIAYSLVIALVISAVVSRFVKTKRKTLKI